MGCRSLLRGTARQAHSEACRKRMGREMTGDERAKKVEGRAFEFFSKTLEMSDKQRTEDKEREEAKKRRLENVEKRPRKRRKG